MPESPTPNLAVQAEFQWSKNKKYRQIEDDNRPNNAGDNKRA